MRLYNRHFLSLAKAVVVDINVVFARYSSWDDLTLLEFFLVPHNVSLSFQQRYSEYYRQNAIAAVVPSEAILRTDSVSLGHITCTENENVEDFPVFPSNNLTCCMLSLTLVWSFI